MFYDLPSNPRGNNRNTHLKGQQKLYSSLVFLFSEERKKPKKCFNINHKVSKTWFLKSLMVISY